jgi:integrase/recombinase XerD
MWLHGRSKRTIESYRTDVGQFLGFVDRPLQDVTLKEIQEFATELERRQLKPTSQTRKINAVKSLFTFATEQQHLSINVAAGMKPPQHSPNLAGRILTREEVNKIIDSAKSERDRLFLLVTYALALRASEACSLKWEDFTVRSDGKVQVSICGKGGKTASVIVPNSVWEKLQVLRGSDERLFRFERREAHNIIKQAVKNAGLNPKISLHWLRHALAKHSLEAGAPIHLVRDTLRHASVATTNFYLSSFPDQSANDYLEF